MVRDVQKMMVPELNISAKEKLLEVRKGKAAMHFGEIYLKDTMRTILRLIVDRCRESTAGKVDHESMKDSVKSLLNWRNCSRT